MTAAPPEIDNDTFTEIMEQAFAEFDEGVIFLLGVAGVALTARTPAAFKINNNAIEVLVDTDLVVTQNGWVCKVVAETSDGKQYVGPSGCGCGGNHPVPVTVGDVVTVKAGAFKCV